MTPYDYGERQGRAEHLIRSFRARGMEVLHPWGTTGDALADAVMRLASARRAPLRSRYDTHSPMGPRGQVSGQGRF